MRQFLFVLLLIPGVAFSAGGETPIPLLTIEPNTDDQASLQRGMRTFMNYCHGCHSLQYQRYVRTADDLGIPHALMMEHVVFDPAASIGDQMDNAMSEEIAKLWFGAPPPDLTLYTKLKGGPDYFYTYMLNFYEDANRPFGVNNLLFENVGMPHVLSDLQGLQRKGCKQIPKRAANGGGMRSPWYLAHRRFITEEKCGQDLIDRGYSPLELVEGSGQLSVEEYTQLVYDLTNFLYYVGDPALQDRERTGILILLFLAFFFVFTYLLGREYTKEFH